MDERQLDRVIQGRSQLVERLWAVGLPSLRLKVKENRKIKTARTDGTYFEYNPEWAADLSIGQLAYTWLRATGHNLLLHPWRIGWRDVKLANEAGEYAINSWIGPLCKQAGWTMPDDAKFDPRFDGLSLEDVYAILEHERRPEPQPQPKDDEDETDGLEGFPGGESEDSDDESEDDESEDESDGGDSKSGKRKGSKPGKSGSSDGEPDGEDDKDGSDLDEPSFTHAKRPGDKSDEDTESVGSEGEPDDGEEMGADDWRNLGAQVDMLARKAGMLPGELDAAMKEARKPRVDWRDELLEFVQSITPIYQTWDTPNRRMMGASIAMGNGPLYLPGVKREGTPPILVFADTSGSTQSFVQDFADEFVGLHREMRPEKTTIVAIDASVQSVHEYGPDDEPEFQNAGGGGTRFAPAFEWLDEQWEKPACVIYLTDGECFDVPVDPMIPTLWVLPEWCQYNAPFGRVVKIPRVA